MLILSEESIVVVYVAIFKNVIFSQKFTIKCFYGNISTVLNLHLYAC